MPSDAEFERALRTRDCCVFKRGFYLLAMLDSSWHAKDTPSGTVKILAHFTTTP